MDGPDFINLHHKHSLETKSHLSVVFGNACDLYLVDLDAVNLAIEFNDPIQIRRCIGMLGGCNGLLALENRAGDLAIINPSTRRYKTLPISEHVFFSLSGVSSRQHVLMGFGHYPAADDHKLLRKMNLFDQGFEVEGRNCCPEVSINGVKAKTWKKIDDFPDHFDYLYGCGVLVGHTLHCAVTRKSDNSTVIFLIRSCG